MRLARKLFLLAVTAVAALALTATTASAQIEVSDESSGNDCSTVTLNVHQVSGGCHLEVFSTEHIPLVAFVPSRVVLSNCNVHLNARIGGNGEGYVTEAVLTNETIPTNPPCTRAPCDEANGTFRPWPIHIEEHAAGNEEVEATFCLRLGNAFGGVPGDAGSQCDVHLAFTQATDHTLTIGADPSTEACEVSPSPPAVIAIEDARFIYELDSNRIEVVH